MADVEFIDNSAEILKLLEKATEAAAHIIGDVIVRYAKGNCAPKGPMGNPMRDGTELRNSITHLIEKESEGPVLLVGSNMQIAPYIELGTGKEYDPPQEWLEYHGDDGHTKGGLDSWLYKDKLEGVIKVGKPIPAQPYLRPAVMDHVDEFKKIVEDSLKDA